MSKYTGCGLPDRLETNMGCAGVGDAESKEVEGVDGEAGSEEGGEMGAEDAFSESGDGKDGVIEGGGGGDEKGADEAPEVASEMAMRRARSTDRDIFPKLRS